MPVTSPQALTPEPALGSGVGAFVEAFAYDFLGPVAKAAGVTLDPAQVHVEMLDRRPTGLPALVRPARRLRPLRPPGPHPRRDRRAAP
jgi:hypothetical protein